MLAEKGQYICNSCNASIAEYREFKKQDETGDVGDAKPIEQVSAPQVQSTPQPPKETVTQPGPVTSISSIEGRAVYDESANKVGTAKQVGIDSTQSMVLIITQNDGSEGSIPWKNIKKVGEVILLGNPEDVSQPGKCSNCGFGNKEGSKFCEDCGTAI